MSNTKHFPASSCQGRWPLFMCHAAAILAFGIASSLSPTAVHAQSTTTSIFGQAPAGQVVTARSSSGLHRHETVNKKGRYKIGLLPAGEYTVTLEKDGQTVDTRSHIPLVIGRSAEIDFACPADNCAASESR